MRQTSALLVLLAVARLVAGGEDDREPLYNLPPLPGDRKWKWGET